MNVAIRSPRDFRRGCQGFALLFHLLPFERLSIENHVDLREEEEQAKLALAPECRFKNLAVVEAVAESPADEKIENAKEEPPREENRQDGRDQGDHDSKQSKRSRGIGSARAIQNFEDFNIVPENEAAHLRSSLHNGCLQLFER